VAGSRPVRPSCRRDSALGTSRRKLTTAVKADWREEVICLFDPGNFARDEWRRKQLSSGRALVQSRPS